MIVLKKKAKVILSRLMNNKLLTSVLKISSGIVVSQFILAIFTPIISRLYTPSDIGEYSIIKSVSTLISVVAMLGLAMAIMIPKEDEEARGLCQFMTYTLFLVSFVICTGILLLYPSYVILETELPYSIVVLFLFMDVCLFNISAICYSYTNRKGMYKVLFWNPIIGSVINIGFSILFGVLKFKFIGYVMAHVISYVFMNLHCIMNANPYKKVINAHNRPMKVIKRYTEFPKYQLPANVISSVTTQIPIQYLGKVFESSVLGLYSMALRLLGLPISLLATPVNRVYYKEATNRFQSGQVIGEFTMRVLETNIKVAIIPISVLIVFGKPIISLLLGAQWREAGDYITILGVYFLISFCSSCLSGNFIIIGRQRTNFYFSVAQVLVNIAIFAVSFFFFKTDVFATLIAYAVANTLFQVLMQSAFLVATGISRLRLVRFFAMYLLLPILISVVINILIW